MIFKAWLSPIAHLNTPRLITDQTNRPVWSWVSDAFGATAANDDPDGDGQAFEFNLRFPGQYFDEETGAHYNYFRSYAPNTGRYLEADPIGILFGSNSSPEELNHLYTYVGGNPMRYYDPFGLEPWDWDGKGNTSICEYYDKQAKNNPKCGYYSRAAEICRGQDRRVNFMTNMAIQHAWATKRTTKSSSGIYNDIRSKLIYYDMQARQSRKTDDNGCTCGDTVDFYHDQAFEEAGVSIWFYGGNIWPQNTAPNPVPYDSRGSETKDDVFN